MKPTSTLTVVTLLVALATFGTFRATQSARASWEASPIPPESSRAVSPIAAPSPDYTVLPSETDGNQDDCPDSGIGCDERWGDYAPNEPHALSVPSSKNTGKLLVFFTGAGGFPAAPMYHSLYNVATLQGYHVIGLTYFTGTKVNDNGVGKACDNNLSCYEKFMQEVIDGTNCEADECSELNINDHPQDSIRMRLFHVLRWARAEYPDDGWDRYLTTVGATETVNWEQIHLAGFSLGSGHAALMGILYPDVKRVALFAGPNDGDGDSEEWDSADYIQPVTGITDTHYYGLVHEKNRSTLNDSKLYQVTSAWQTFGMEEPFNPPTKYFDPNPNNDPPENFMGAHMLVSTDLQTTYDDAHESVVRNVYDCEDHTQCPFGEKIGYEPAWRCILGTGDVSLSSTPIADAGPNQTVECEGGGATVTLDGSATRDIDCGVLTYTWKGSFGEVTGRKPEVFLPVGTHLVTLEVKDEWSNANSKTVLITVQDTQPPTISCPTDIVVEPTCSSGAVATYTAPVGADVCAEAITTRTAGLASGSIFPIGTTTVTYTATDDSNNAASCSFAVKVLTAAEVIQDLIGRVQALQPPLSGQQAQGLRSKLNEALLAIDSGKKNVACNKLNDFINQVQTYINNGKLTSAQGQPLINSAAHVQNTLGCTALGCT